MTADNPPPAGNDHPIVHHHAHHEAPHGIKAASHEGYGHEGKTVASLNEHSEPHAEHAKKKDAHKISSEKPLTGLDDPRIEKVAVHKAPTEKSAGPAAPAADTHAGHVAVHPAAEVAAAAKPHKDNKEVAEAKEKAPKAAADAAETLEPRAKTDVKQVDVRLGHKKDDPPANYVIDNDGHIKQQRSPDTALHKGDNAVTIEVQAGSKLSKDQQAALDGLVKAVKKDYPDTKETQISADMQDVIDRTNAGPRLPAIAPKERGGDVGTPHGPKDWGSHAGNRGGNGGHVPSAAEARARGDEVPFSAAVDWSKLPHGLDRNNQTDRIAALISSNEGKPTSINWNDNGAGVSVGMFQANQRKGELPKLFSDFANTPDGYETLVEIFGAEMAAKMKANPEMIRGLNFNSHNELGKELEQLVQNPAFQQLQLDQIRGKIQEAAPVAQEHGITSEAGVALVADLTNQFGSAGAARFLGAADGVQDQEGKARAIARAVHNNSQYGGRYAADIGKMNSAGLSFHNTYDV